MATVTEDLANEVDLPVDTGALVEHRRGRQPGRRGRTARLGQLDELSGDLTEAGDVIVGVDGEPVASADDVVYAVAGKQPGDTVELEIYRGDDKRTVSVKLGERPEELGQAAPCSGRGLALPCRSADGSHWRVALCGR